LQKRVGSKWQNADEETWNRARVRETPLKRVSEGVRGESSVRKGNGFQDPFSERRNEGPGRGLLTGFDLRNKEYLPGTSPEQRERKEGKVGGRKKKAEGNSERRKKRGKSGVSTDHPFWKKKLAARPMGGGRNGAIRKSSVCQGSGGKGGARGRKCSRGCRARKDADSVVSKKGSARKKRSGSIQKR